MGGDSRQKGRTEYRFGDAADRNGQAVREESELGDLEESPFALLQHLLGEILGATKRLQSRL